MPIDLPDDYDAFKSDVVSDQGDDDQGAYEVWWHANSRYPDQPLSTRLAIAESVVSDLREGRITSRQWCVDRFDHAREAVVDVDAVLRDWATWVPQPDKPVVWMADS